jgi:hypothetical protein
MTRGRKKTDRTAPFRAERYRLNKQDAGWRQQGFLFPPDVARALDVLSAARGVSKNALVCGLIRTALDDAMAEEL